MPMTVLSSVVPAKRSRDDVVFFNLCPAHDPRYGSKKMSRTLLWTGDARPIESDGWNRD